MLAEPIVRLLFERGAFTAASTDRASLALICLAPGLVAFSTVNILARAFFALGDTKTPMKISLACLTLNLLLAAALVVPLKQGGLGIANTVTSVCNAGLLFFALRKKLGRLEMAPLRATFLPLAIAGLLAGLDRVAGLAVVGKFARPRNPRVENRRGVCAGHRRRVWFMESSRWRSRFRRRRKCWSLRW